MLCPPQRSANADLMFDALLSNPPDDTDGGPPPRARVTADYQPLVCSHTASRPLVLLSDRRPARDGSVTESCIANKRHAS